MRSRTDNSADRVMHLKLPAELHRLLRIHVADLDTSIQKWVVELVARELGYKEKKASK